MYLYISVAEIPRTIVNVQSLATIGAPSGHLHTQFKITDKVFPIYLKKENIQLHPKVHRYVQH